MDIHVLVIGEDPSVRDAVDDMLLGRAGVTWVRTPDDTEGLGIDVVLIDEPYGQEYLKQVRVHPRLHSSPVLLVEDVSRAPELAESLERTLARVTHPSNARHYAQTSSAA